MLVITRGYINTFGYPPLINHGAMAGLWMLQTEKMLTSRSVDVYKEGPRDATYLKKNRDESSGNRKISSIEI